jgi:acetoin utilization protein AcuB
MYWMINGQIYCTSVQGSGGEASMDITQAMTPNPVTIRSDATLAKANSLMDAGGFRRLPVVENGRLIGILTERDLHEHLGYLGNTVVSAVMSTRLITVTAKDTVEEAARTMLKHKIGALPVLQNGSLMGIVTASDLLSALLRVLGATEHILDP